MGNIQPDPKTCLVILMLALTACTPAESTPPQTDLSPTVPFDPERTVSSPTSSVPVTGDSEATLEMVAPSSIAVADTSPDTLVIAEIRNHNLVLGMRSAFGQQLMNATAVVLLERSHMPPETLSLGTVTIGNGSAITSDQVFILTLGAEERIGAASVSGRRVLELRPRVIGRLVAPSTEPSDVMTVTDIQSVAQRLEVSLPLLNGVDTAECVDWIQCFCLQCGCCRQIGSPLTLPTMSIDPTASTTLTAAIPTPDN